MKLSELTPDIVLADLLGKVEVTDASTKRRKVAVYAQCEQPQSDLADEFITIAYNGNLKSYTREMDVCNGNLLLSINSKCSPYNTINRKRISSIIDQCVELCNGVCRDKFYFQFDYNSVVTPITTSITDGYATTILNVVWHTT